MSVTALVCTRCGQSLDACQCPDADARLHAVAYDPGGLVLFKWCRTCDRHFARCGCLAPAFFILCAGKDITEDVRHGLPNALGGLTIPDLTCR